MTTARVGDLRIGQCFRTLQTGRLGRVSKRISAEVHHAVCYLGPAPGIQEEKNKLLHEAVRVELLDWRAA